MMVVFRHQYFRETTIRRGPIWMDGHRLSLVRHEDADFRFHAPYDKLVEIASTNFPPEHHNYEGIRDVFQVFGQVCCIDPTCIREVDSPRDYGIADYSVVRVLVRLDHGKVVTPELLVRNPLGAPAGLAKLWVLREWDHPAGAPAPTHHDFSDIDSDIDSPPQGDWSASPGLTRTTNRTESAVTDLGSTSAGARASPTRALGARLYPSAPLWTFVAGAFSALARALSLGGCRWWSSGSSQLLSGH